MLVKIHNVASAARPLPVWGGGIYNLYTKFSQI